MGNCDSKICTSKHPIQADPDIAGPGAIAAFIATAVITFVAIVVGYLTDSLPDATLTQFDQACLARISEIKWWLPSHKKNTIGSLLRRGTNTLLAVNRTGDFEKIDDRAVDDDERRRRARHRRSKGLERFILALSDQQLVTGLAVLIASFFSPCSRSLYHFNITASLGWFSSTCHLSTLSVLRIYLIDHPRVRDWRVLAMLIVMGLTIVSQVITYADQDIGFPVQCVLHDLFPFGYDLNSILGIVLIVGFLAYSYTNRIARLYLLDPDWSIVGWFTASVAKLLGKRKQMSQLQDIIIAMSAKSQAEKTSFYRRVEQRRQFARFCGFWVANPGIVRRRFIWLMYCFRQLSGSFLGEILTLLFGVSYGITSVLFSRFNVPEVGLSGDQNSMGFGQLVPLLLIVLPILTANEVYFERHDYPTPSLEASKFKLVDPFDEVAVAIRETLELPENQEAPTYHETRHRITREWPVPVDSHAPANHSGTITKVGFEDSHNCLSNTIIYSKEPKEDIASNAGNNNVHPEVAAHIPDLSEKLYEYKISERITFRRQVRDLLLRERSRKSPSTWRYVLLAFLSTASLIIFVAIMLGGIDHLIGNAGAGLYSSYLIITLGYYIGIFIGSILEAGIGRGSKAGRDEVEAFVEMLLRKQKQSPSPSLNPSP